jgi:hypothetical protein
MTGDPHAGTKVRADSCAKKACKCRPSRKRLMGFKPTTFCMASRPWGTVVVYDVPGNGRFCRRCARSGSLGFTADSREFED